MKIIEKRFLGFSIGEKEMKKIICATLLVEKSPQALPLGAACIASSIKKYCKDTETLVFSPTQEDAEYFQKSTDEKAKFFVEKILEFSGNKADVVCLSVYVWNRLVLEKVGEMLMSKGILVIAGGPEITANPESFSGADYVVSGEGEGSVPELINHHYGNNGEKSLNSDFIIKDCGKVKLVKWGKSLSGEELTSPYLDGTIDLSKYEGALWELARGCPFKCSYCYESKGEKKVRLLPMERIEKELKLFAEKDVPQVFVLDPTYNANKERALNLLKIIV